MTKRGKRGPVRNGTKRSTPRNAAPNHVSDRVSWALEMTPGTAATSHFRALPLMPNMNAGFLVLAGNFEEVRITAVRITGMMGMAASFTAFLGDNLRENKAIFSAGTQLTEGEFNQFFLNQSWSGNAYSRGAGQTNINHTFNVNGPWLPAVRVNTARWYEKDFCRRTLWYLWRTTGGISTPGNITCTVFFQGRGNSEQA